MREKPFSMHEMEVSDIPYGNSFIDAGKQPLFFS